MGGDKRPTPSSAAVSAQPAVAAKESPGLAEFRQHIRPILEKNCYDCHAGAKQEAGVAFDALKTEDQILGNPTLWMKVLKNTRAGVMPAEGGRLPAKDQAALDHWIKFAAFGVDPQRPDPGRVTVHRLNRLEYRNTVRDLLGVDFDATASFPGDDIGHGFDNIADVLSMSPLLMEKYLAAAQAVVDQAVPLASRVPPTSQVLGRDFVNAETGLPPPLDSNTVEDGVVPRTAAITSYLEPLKLRREFTVSAEGGYRLVIEEGVSGNFNPVAASCKVSIWVDGKLASERVVPWRGANALTERLPSFYDTLPVRWAPGKHVVEINAEPYDVKGTAEAQNKRGNSGIFFLLRSATLEGPDDVAKWVNPAGYARFFTRPDAPAEPAARRAYARELLGHFAGQAFRRPAPAETVDDLVDLAESVYRRPGKTFEMGVAQAMVAVLASPRFLFRIDEPEATPGRAGPFAPVDELSLASRLSYFLWSTMPDDELMRLAAAGQLRKNLAAQVRRMTADPRADTFVKNFSGQWLQSRAVTTVPISAHEVYLREGFNAGAIYDLTAEQRAALEAEAQAYFGYVARENRSVDELLDSNYMFLNSTLAEYYFDGAFPVQGAAMRKVEALPDNWRGGVLTLGSVLMVTSNPTRTSPVKRGKWILENILDAPAPPPPPNIPALKEDEVSADGKTPSQREILARHRADPNCASCHDRMDPLGLALENFNALGIVRKTDMGQPVDTKGQLVTGETFADIRELKRALLTSHREEFYRCLTGKLLTYALGRGLEQYDVATVDVIVEKLLQDGGKFSTLLNGVIESVAFQQQRLVADPPPAKRMPPLAANPAPRP
jgi:mono/diheme cytochrome c family protein